MSFAGALLARGFWLYVWWIRSPGGLYLYIGRTGDSSSPHASSPFNRIGQHLDLRRKAKSNALARQLKAAGLTPSECSFEMLAMGPLFPEQASMKRHGPVRDTVAALEKELAQFLRSRGYSVLGTHGASARPDAALLRRVLLSIRDEFPERSGLGPCPGREVASMHPPAALSSLNHNQLALDCPGLCQPGLRV